MTSGLGSISLSHSTLPRWACSSSTRRATSAPISGVSGAPAQSTSWALGVDVAHRLEQVRDALLARDAPDEDDRRRVGVDAVALEHVGARGRARTRRCRCRCRSSRRGRGRSPGRPSSRSSRIPSETATIASAASTAVRSQKRRQRVAAAELLGLPRAQRLERVHGDDVRDVVHELGQVAAEVRVPGVAVDEVGVGRARGHRQVDRHRAQRGELGRRAVQRVPRLVADRRPSRSAPQAWTSTSIELAQLAREVLDVDARRRRRRRAGTRA